MTLPEDGAWRRAHRLFPAQFQPAARLFYTTTRMKKVIVAIHGIITDEEASSWQNRFEFFVADQGADVEVLKREYFEGPFPIFNVFVKNWFVARALAKYLLPYYEAGFEVSFVTHSNGADVGLRVIKRLAALKFKTHAAVFIAGAIQSDVCKNGVAQLIDDGMLGKAVAYSSTADEVLGCGIIWPYGHLGRVGFTNPGHLCNAEFDSGKIRTIWFRNYGHGSYFYTANERDTFTRVLGDCA